MLGMGFGCVGYVFLFMCLCRAQDNLRIGAFYNKGQDMIHFWNFVEENLDENLKLVQESEPSTIQTVHDYDITDIKHKLCSFVSSVEEERIVAVLGPKSQTSSAVMESISSFINIPYFITTWRPRAAQIGGNVFSLYPDADLLASGYAKIIESFDWSAYVVLFEDEEGLLRLQEVLKLQKHEKDVKTNSIILHKLEATGDNRHVLKGLRTSAINRVILDCHVDRILHYFQQADEVGLLRDFSISFFLTSLDAHTLNFTHVATQANITTVRMFDPSAQHIEPIVSKYFGGNPAIRLESALTFDALALITETLNQLKKSNTVFSPVELNCDSDEKYKDGDTFIEALSNINVENGITGAISLQNRKRDKFTLEVIQTNAPQKPIAIWNSESPEEIRLTRNATEREAELQERLSHYKFIVTSRVGAPYLFENKNPDENRYGKYYGFSYDLINEIAKLMNITFEFRLTKKNLYANLVEDLVERRADLGICDFTITPQRQQMIDFSMPFMNLGIGILHVENTQEQADNMYAFMRPISWTVWFYIWTLSLVSSTTCFLVARMASGEWENPKPWDPESKELENIWTIKNFLWLSLGSITAQGCDILPKSVPARVISASWWFFSLIIISSYTANLAAFLTMQKRDVTVDSVEELAAQSKIKYGLVAGASTETFFSTSNVSLYQKMWNTMKNEKPSVFENDNSAGVERVNQTKNGLYAYFMESTQIEYEMERKCTLRRIGGLLDSKSYGIGMPLNADYRHAINKHVLTLQESGKLMELKDRWWKKNREGEPCSKNVEVSSDALALSNVGGIFMVLGIGIGLAYIIAISEFLWNVRQLSIEEHLSYMETFKCEVKFAFNIFSKKKRARPVPSESTSSTKSEPGHDKLSLARSIFSKSMSMLNMDEEAVIRSRHSVSGGSRSTHNHLRIKN